MKKKVPVTIASYQPIDFETIKSGRTRLFNLYPRKKAEELGRFLREKVSLDLYPIGTFISGDFVCWAGGNRVVIVLHDSYEPIRSRVPLDQFMKRLKEADKSLEDDAYA
jgi:hypothetical protein